MANTFVKSPQITLLDSNFPRVGGPSGSGLTGQYSASDYVGGGARIVRSVIGDTGALGIASTQASTVVNRILRVRDDIIVSKLEAWIDIPTGVTVTTFAVNVGLYYSDRAGDVPPSLFNAAGFSTGTAISDSFFAYQVDLHAATTPTDITLNNAAGHSVTDGFYTGGALEYQLWDAVQNGGADRTLVSNAAGAQPNQVYTQGVGYSSGASNQWTAPYNSGTVLPAGIYQFGSPKALVDICARPSGTVSATGAFTLFLRLTYLTPAAP